MIQKIYNIGISCIGSGVGQSVINSIRISRLPLRTIGFGSNSFAYGAYDCDDYEITPSIYVPSYIDLLIEKCKKHSVDLIIPGLDDEALIFAQNIEKFEQAGIIALVAREEFVALCRSKGELSCILNKSADLFVKSFTPESIKKGIKSGGVNFPFIAKPRDGSASRGIEIIRSEEDFYKITNNHIIQELAVPASNDPNYDFFMSQINNGRNSQVAEISIQIVVSKDGNLVGRMASYNKLRDGVPIEIIPVENDLIWEAVDKLMPVFLELGLQGPLNLQGRITDHGIKFFELNPRFTGITGLRALMGFNEVEACIKLWLDIEKEVSLALNRKLFGIRQVADKSIPVERNKEVADLYNKVNNNNHGQLNKKRILITGAGGYLGLNLIKYLSTENQFDIWAFDLKKDKLSNLPEDQNVSLFDLSDLNSGRLSLGNVDVLLHLGFARPHCTNEQIADSIAFSGQLFTQAAMCHVPAIIYISSQSVYGLGQEIPWHEETPVAPETVYAQAKYAVEVILENSKKWNNQLFFTSLRLATITGGQQGLIFNELVSKFVNNVLRNENILIKGGTQVLERLDVRDAVRAISKLLKTNPVEWESLYNLGSGVSHNIIEIAEAVIKVCSKLGIRHYSKIILEEGEHDLKISLDSSLFMKKVGWSPIYSLESTIETLVNYMVYHARESRKSANVNI